MNDLNEMIEEQIQSKRAHLEKAREAREDYQFHVKKAALAEERIQSYRKGRVEQYDRDELVLSFTEQFY